MVNSEGRCAPGVGKLKAAKGKSTPCESFRALFLIAIIDQMFQSTACNAIHQSKKRGEMDNFGDGKNRGDNVAAADA